MTNPTKTFLTTATLLMNAAAFAPAWATVEVQAAAKPDAEWKSYPTRPLEDLPAVVTSNPGRRRWQGI